MARVFYVHWDLEELEAPAATLRGAGHIVTAHGSANSRLSLDGEPPDAVVISLDRLPSHGRAVAEWFQEAKKRRAIPLLFAGGASDRVAATREKFPNAVYCATEDVLPTLERVLRPAAPE